MLSAFLPHTSQEDIPETFHEKVDYSAQRYKEVC